MTIKVFLSLIIATCVCSGTALVEARQPKTTVAPAKASTSQAKKSVLPVKPKVSEVIQPKWTLFNAPDGRFSVLMPGVPKRDTQSQKTYMGEINLELFVAQPPKQEVAYIVAYNDFPYAYGQMANPQQILNNAQTMALKTTKSNLISQRNIRSSNGHPGKEIEYINSIGKVTKTRMYFAEGRLYQVTAIVSKKQRQTLAKTITGYLNSFQVVLKS
ncbi:MAG: hypothetical protein HEQ35_01350 [Gloeotrichia echinulata IR180]|jgi:hypothetical protein|nr:hypothetical protein [Gloeotrichia echinulata DEX184]